MKKSKKTPMTEEAVKRIEKNTIKTSDGKIPKDSFAERAKKALKEKEKKQVDADNRSDQLNPNNKKFHLSTKDIKKTKKSPMTEEAVKRIEKNTVKTSDGKIPKDSFAERAKKAVEKKRNSN